MSKRLVLIGCLLSLAACGGSGDDPAPAYDSAGAGAASQGTAVESSLTVTLGGETFASKSRVKESGVKFGDRMDAVLIADSYSDPSGLPELSMTIITPTRKEGAFEIVFNQNKIARAEGKDIAIVTFQSAPSVKLMKGLKGTLTIGTLKTTPQGSNYTIERLTGSFEGTFRSDGGGDIPVQGSFDYAK